MTMDRVTYIADNKYQILTVSGATKNFEKVMDVYHRFEEQNIEPRRRTLVYLSKLLSANDMEVPFKVPENVV